MKTLGEDLQGFMRLWERICKDLGDFGRGFARICRGFKDLLDFGRGFHKDSSDFSGDFGRGFARIHETLGENLQGLGRLWERIRETLGEDS